MKKVVNLLLTLLILFTTFIGNAQIIYKHSFDSGPYSHPYTVAPNVIDPNLSTTGWTNSINAWTSYNGVTGKALSVSSATATTLTMTLNLNVASGKYAEITSFSFADRSSSTGYANWAMYVNGTVIGNGNVFVDQLTGSAPLQSTGNYMLPTAMTNLTGAVAVTLVLSGGSHGATGTFRLDDFTLNGTVGVKRNYVREFVPQKPTTNSNDIGITAAQQTVFPAITSTKYYDGVGRDIQDIIREGVTEDATGLKNDFVTTHVYDNMGREAKKYGAFSIYDGTVSKGKFKENAVALGTSQYNNDYPGEPAYSVTDFDQSPLSKVQKVKAPGSSWVGIGKGVSTDYNVNTADDKIILFTIGNTPFNYTFGTFGNLPSIQGFYQPGQLYKTTTTDEDGNWKIEYKDISDKTIAVQRPVDLSSISPSIQYKYFNITYYVYDDFDRLRAVISPEGYKQMMQTNISNNVIDGLCYQYCYDDRGNLIVKKLPGKDPEYLIYDNRNLNVAVQDGNLRELDEWYFHLYDCLDRPIATGLEMNDLHQPSDWLPYVRNGIVSSDITNLKYYLSHNLFNQYPLAFMSNGQTDKLVFYDDYSNSNLSNYSFNTSYNNQLTGDPNYCSIPVMSQQTRGLITGSRVKLLKPVNGISWLTLVNYYDDKGRMIQKQTTNVQNGIDISTFQFDFSGIFVSAVLYHNNPNAISPDLTAPAMHKNTHIVQRYEKNYQNGNIEELDESVNNSPFKQIYKLSYDKYGRLSNKQLGLATNKYHYNIRGWQTGINEEYIDAPSPSDVFFVEQLHYNLGGTYSLLNGNITGIEWKGANGSFKSRYSYAYDELNRISGAEYGEWKNSYWDNAQRDFSASNISYDYNGNIRMMNQRGPNIAAGGSVDMDLLTYTYQPGTNRLAGVTDAGTITSQMPDFKDDPAHSAADYNYDANGNLTADGNKGITNVTYNYLNKPEHIEISGKGTVNYYYDALGTKLRTISTTVAGLADTTDYMDNFIYHNNLLESFSHAEGRYRPNMAAASGGNANFYTDYYIKDHLGNIRSVVNNDATTAAVDYVATMESSAAFTEETVWDNLSAVRDVKPGSSSSTDQYASKLIGTDAAQRVGGTILLRVMPGDNVNIGTDYFFSTSSSTVSSTPQDVASSLISALAGNAGGGISLGEVGDKASFVNGINQPGFSNLINQINAAANDPSLPPAYLNYMVFDDQFHLISENSGSVQATNASSWTNISTGPIDIKEPGFILVFTSSNSADDVYFDNESVSLVKGSVLEQNHYYPFGLTISSTSVNPNEKNRYKYNGIELQNDFGLQTYDAYFRTLDPQIGRWWQIDPKPKESLSPYVSMDNNPVSNIDPMGDYSRFGAWWRNLVDGGSGIYKSGSEWGYNTTDKDGFTFHDGSLEKLKSAYAARENVIDNLERYGALHQNEDGNYVRDVDNKTIDRPLSGRDMAKIVMAPFELTANAAPQLAISKAAPVQWFAADGTKLEVALAGAGSTRQALRQMLKNISSMPRSEIMEGIEKLGFRKVYENGERINYSRGDFNIRFDPPHKGADFYHIHFELGTGRDRASLSTTLEMVNPNSSAAHTPTQAP